MHLGENLDQLYVQVSLKLNVIETNQFFLQKDGVNQIMMCHKIGTQFDRKSQKCGSSMQNLTTMPKYGSNLPGQQLYRNLLQIIDLDLYIQRQ